MVAVGEVDAIQWMVRGGWQQANAWTAVLRQNFCLVKAATVDLFAHTGHWEVVMLCER